MVICGNLNPTDNKEGFLARVNPEDLHVYWVKTSLDLKEAYKLLVAEGKIYVISRKKIFKFDSSGNLLRAKEIDLHYSSRLYSARNAFIKGDDLILVGWYKTSSSKYTSALGIFVLSQESLNLIHQYFYWLSDSYSSLEFLWQIGATSIDCRGNLPQNLHATILNNSLFVANVDGLNKLHILKIDLNDFKITSHKIISNVTMSCSSPKFLLKKFQNKVLLCTWNGNYIRVAILDPTNLDVEKSVKISTWATITSITVHDAVESSFGDLTLIGNSRYFDYAKGRYNIFALRIDRNLSRVDDNSGHFTVSNYELTLEDSSDKPDGKDWDFDIVDISPDISNSDFITSLPHIDHVEF